MGEDDGGCAKSNEDADDDESGPEWNWRRLRAEWVSDEDVEEGEDRGEEAAVITLGEGELTSEAMLGIAQPIHTLAGGGGGGCSLGKGETINTK